MSDADVVAGISIVTVVRNGAATIGACLESVGSQSYRCEHVIIDGASEDTTLALIGASRHDCKLVSEPDRGIYDAMNKGVTLASSDVIGILNADDVYASHDVLAKVAEVFADPRIEACYGDLIYVKAHDTKKIVRYWHAGGCDRRAFYRGWMPPHPTFFVRRSVYEKYGIFNLDLGSAADYELMLRFLVRYSLPVAYIPEVLVRMRTGGVSNISLLNRLKANRMDRRAWEVNGLTPRPWTLFLKPMRKVGQWFERPRATPAEPGAKPPRQKFFRLRRWK